MQSGLPPSTTNMAINVQLYPKDSDGDEVTVRYNHRLWESLHRPCRLDLAISV